MNIFNAGYEKRSIQFIGMFYLKVIKFIDFK